MEEQGKRWGGGWRLEGWGLGIDLHRQLDVVLGGVLSTEAWRDLARVTQSSPGFFKGGIS